MFTIKYTLKENNGPYTRFIVPRQYGIEGEIVGDQSQARDIWATLLLKRTVNGEAVNPLHCALLYGGTIKEKNTVVEFRICEKMQAIGAEPLVVWNPEPIPAIRNKAEEPEAIIFAATDLVDPYEEMPPPVFPIPESARTDFSKPKRVRVTKPKAE